MLSLTTKSLWLSIPFLQPTKYYFDASSHSINTNWYWTESQISPIRICAIIMSNILLATAMHGQKQCWSVCTLVLETAVLPRSSKAGQKVRHFIRSNLSIMYALPVDAWSPKNQASRILLSYSTISSHTLFLSKARSEGSYEPLKSCISRGTVSKTQNVPSAQLTTWLWKIGFVEHIK